MTKLPSGDAPSPDSPADFRLRELLAAREIVRAFLPADRPEDVFQFALDHVSPLVGAAWSSVYLIDGASELMRLAAVHNWPEKYAPFLGQMRVRLGAGPSGQAASECRVVEVDDVFADPALGDWQEVARELGFRALVALPLRASQGVLGAVTFYFDHTGEFGADARHLLQMVADQMAATAEKARLIEDLRRANAHLAETNAELERQYVALLEARRVKDEFLANISHELRTPLTAVIGYIAIMQEGIAGPVTAEQQTTLTQVKGASEQLLGLIDDLLELTTLKRGGLDVDVTEFDASDALREAVAATKGRPESVALEVDAPDVAAPMRSDRKKVVKLLVSLLSNAYKFTPSGTVRATIEIRLSPRGDDDRVIYRIEDTGIGIPAAAQELVFDEFRQADGSMTRRHGGSGLGLSLARRLARLLGGDISLASEEGNGSTFTADLPLRWRPSDVEAPPGHGTGNGESEQERSVGAPRG